MNHQNIILRHRSWYTLKNASDGVNLPVRFYIEGDSISKIVFGKYEQEKEKKLMKSFCNKYGRMFKSLKEVRVVSPGNAYFVSFLKNYNASFNLIHFIFDKYPDFEELLLLSAYPAYMITSNLFPPPDVVSNALTLNHIGLQYLHFAHLDNQEISMYTHMLCVLLDPQKKRPFNQLNKMENKLVIQFTEKEHGEMMLKNLKAFLKDNNNFEIRFPLPS